VAKKTAGSGPPVIVDETIIQPDPAVQAVSIDAVYEWPVRTKDRCAIVGFADGHRHFAPFADPTWEIWGLNRLHSVQPGRWDRWFEVHDLKQYYEGDPAHREFLRVFPGPIYIRPQDMGLYDIPSAQPYPVVPVLQEYGNYFTNSISWMLAMAISMGFREIGLWGVDMAQDGIFVTGSEYRHQRPSCEYLIGVAIGRGIKITMPPGSDLLKTSFLYGLENGDAIQGKRLSRMAELNRRKDQVRAQISAMEQQKAANDTGYMEQKIALISQINQLDGALQECVYEGGQLSPPPEVQPEPAMIAAAIGVKP